MNPGQEDPLGKQMATHSSILAWRFPWTEEPGGLQYMGHKESDTGLSMHAPVLQGTVKGGLIYTEGHIADSSEPS